ncbi:MAG: hypothetical protein ACQESD_05915 [Thermoplasmatota archaeon]
MNICKISIYIVVVLLVSLPLATADIEHGQESEMTSLTRMKILVYTDYSGENASSVREDIDEWNDSDGFVTENEVNEYKGTLDSLLTEPRCSYFLDDSRGYYDKIEYKIDNAEGSTQSTEPLTIATEWTVVFPEAKSTTHEIKTDNTFNDPGTPYEITCPTDYRFISSQGLKDVTITEDSRTIRATLTDRPITLTLTNSEPEKETPGTTILAVVIIISSISLIYGLTNYNKKRP